MPVAMFAKEHRTGAEIGPLNREQLLACAGRRSTPDPTFWLSLCDRRRACRASRCWAGRYRAICRAAYFETYAAINGLDIEGLRKSGRASLEACDLFGIPHMPEAHKKAYARRDLEQRDLY